MYHIKVPDSYVISNDLGSFYFWSEVPYSKFCGLHFNVKGTIFKCLESAVTPQKLRVSNDSYTGILNQREGMLESIYLSRQKNAIAFRYSHPTEILLNFDIKKHDDWDEWGRHYEISEVRGCILLTFHKRGQEEYTVYAAIKSRHKNFDKIARFVERDYSYDEYRHSQNVRYIFEALKLYSSHFTIAFSTDKNEAIYDAKHLYRHYDVIHRLDKRSGMKIDIVMATEDISSAYKHAQLSLSRLVNDNGIYAGYPWFCQVWSRDELISMVPYIKFDPEFAKGLISKYFKHNNYCGRLPAILPDKGLKSADGAGWLAMRLQQLIKSNPDMFKSGDKHKYALFFEKMIFFLQKYHHKNELVFSDMNETWMDTSYEDDGRKGYCIEIQALALRMLDLMHMLTGDEKYHEQLQDLKKAVRRLFYSEDDKIIYDHLDEDMKPTGRIRPNIFIAHYVFPDMFTKEEWEQAFDTSLKALWLKWGGLSTLDQGDPRFVDEYTGEDNKSYHRGDSWYFLNCMAAMAMYKVDKKKYMPKIDKIIESTTKDCLENGVIGSIAEVSPAKSQDGVGCLSQAWSLAMYIELIDLVYG
ncbi:hypothetical protein H6503_04740 [Candidatus Woesearchaeota archaeon]|nr:hypothetical protein [Candidatus Woesearchaeota archaeon]